MRLQPFQFEENFIKSHQLEYQGIENYSLLMNIFCDKITRLLCQINRDESLLFNSIGKENIFPLTPTFLKKNSSALLAIFIATNLFLLPSSLNWSLSQEMSTPLLEDKRV